MSEISLTASMRSNLLSLQNIASQQDIVQNRLATGLKVSSAIDNPSSYYTASSLSNRAADLTALLDAMSQGIQTIKAASEAIDSGTKFLEQAKAAASQALETPSTSLAQLPPIVAEVSSEAELLAAIDSGKKGTIVIKNDITLSENQKLILKDGQSLAGAGFDSANPAKPSLSFNFTSSGGSAIELGDGSIVSDLTLNLTSNQSENSLINVKNGNQASVQNLNMTLTMPSNIRDVANSLLRAEGGKLTLRGNFEGSVTGHGRFLSASGEKSSVIVKTGSIVNFQASGKYIRGIEFYEQSHLTIEKSVTMNFDLTSTTSASIVGIYMNGAFSEIDSADINIRTSGTGKGIGLDANNGGSLLIKGNSKINIETLAEDSIGLWAEMGAKLDIGGSVQMNIKSKGTNTYAFKITDDNSSINLLSAQVQLNLISAKMLIQGATAGQSNRLTLVKGAKVSWSNTDKSQQGIWSAAGKVDLQQKDTNREIDGFENVAAMQRQSSTAADLPDLPADLNELTKEENLESDNSFNKILEQYDQLIADASYKGINLLNSQRLKINFNEDRSSGIEILGVSALSADLGIVTTEWQSKADIEKSVSELEEAINTLRGYASQYGNYYSIVTTRQDFTENLINVLEEGADKLTLADMNQESANMLALQTSQQLAVNSLSLASQASQAVLRLF